MMTNDFEKLSYPQAIKLLIKRDSILSKVILNIGPFEMIIIRNPFRALCYSIIHQQIHGKIAKNKINEIEEIYPMAFIDPTCMDTIPIGFFRNKGLTMRKEDTIRNIAKKYMESNHVITNLESLSSSKLISILTSIKGVGLWTANMFQIFHMGRLDVLVKSDIGLQKAIGLNYLNGFIPSSDDIDLISEKWIPYRTIASWYLWKSLPGFSEPGIYPYRQ